MSIGINFHTPNCKEFRLGYDIYNQKEKKGPIYFEASSKASDNWGNPEGMAEAIGIIIRGWNYLFSNFDFNRLVQCITDNIKVLEEFRGRNIASLNDSDGNKIRKLFEQFLQALERMVDGRRSPVSAAKGLNVLAPEFLPLWDNPIALEYGHIIDSVIASSQYFDFCKQMKYMADKVKNCVPSPDDRSLLKRIDEYNYAKYTQRWI